MDRFHTAREGTMETSRHGDHGLPDLFRTAREGPEEMRRSPQPKREGSEINDGGPETESKRNPQDGMVNPVLAGVREMRRAPNGGGLEDRFHTAREGTVERERHGDNGLPMQRFRTARHGGSEDY